VFLVIQTVAAQNHVIGQIDDSYRQRGAFAGLLSTIESALENNDADRMWRQTNSDQRNCMSVTTCNVPMQYLRSQSIPERQYRRLSPIYHHSKTEASQRKGSALPAFLKSTITQSNSNETPLRDHTVLYRLTHRS
jgi:hypothetical protein